MLPEGGEFIASYEQFIHILLAVMFFNKNDENPDHTFKPASSGGWKVKRIYADATNEERMGSLSNVDRAKDGLPFVVEPHHNLVRGNGDGHPLWPPGFENLDDFRFQNVHLYSRSLCFDFGVAFLDMHYLTHTSVQIYPRQVWEDRILDVPVQTEETKTKENNKRRFRILIAFEFEDFVIAFLSLDMLGQPKWCATRPPPSLEIFPGWDTDAESLAVPHEWYEALGELIRSVRLPDRLDKGNQERKAMSPEKKKQIAIYAIRHMPELVKCFPGVGVFTANELWFLAGLPPGLTVEELIAEPSRFARLIEAYYVFIWRCKHFYWKDVICPALHNDYRTITVHNTILSPTKEQRLRYAEKFLYVHQQDDIKLFPRHAKLIDDYEAWINSWTKAKLGNKRTAPRNEAPPEPFEPSYIMVAFKKAVHFAHLIFGPDSPLLKDLPRCARDDPVSKAYAAKPDGHKWFVLKPRPNKFTTVAKTYDRLSIPLNQRSLVNVTMHFQARHDQEKGSPVWSVLPPETNRNGQQVPRDVRARKLFHHIVMNTQKVAIGPLEYIGYTAPLKNGPAMEVGVARGDVHMVTGSRAYATIRNFIGAARRSLKFPTDLPGLGYKAMTDEQFKQIDEVARQLMIKEGYAEHVHLIPQWRGRLEKGFHTHEDEQIPALVPVAGEAEPTAAPPKRKRMSVDKKLAMQGAGDRDEVTGGSSRRSKRPR